VSPDAYRNVRRPVVVVSNDYPENFVIRRHRHLRAQLLYPSTGVMTVTTRRGAWVVPPLRAVWIPADTDHSVATAGRVKMKSVNVAPHTARSLPHECCAVSVSPLLRELILRACGLPLLYDRQAAAGRIMQLILDEIRALQALPLHLPMPSHPRVKAICDAILRDPGEPHALAAWAHRVSASTRTVARLFSAHTGMTFSAWRQQARLLAALTRLASGQAVTRVALELGYDSPSAFVSMFRRSFGTTPGRYFSASG